MTSRFDEPTTHDDSTLSSVDNTQRPERRYLALTILHHPDTRRVGDRAELDELERGLPVALSRMRPAFHAADSARGFPLGHPRLSRKPVWLTRKNEQLLVSVSEERIKVKIDGKPVNASCVLDIARIQQQPALIELGGGVLLWLHEAPVVHAPLSQYGIVGVTPQIRLLQGTIARIAPQPVPVLIRGESGVGKELVARAIHDLGPRTRGPWITVNMAAIPVSMAAAELFGHGRGAFTGADKDRKGWFEQADGGTLFLDEIGETPQDIQPQLLRALESGEIQPVGQTSRKVDVHLIAATDADLEALIESGRFRRSLFHRLQSAILSVPPLRDRAADVPLLVHNFLRSQLADFGAESLLHSNSPRQRPWLGITLIHQLMHYHFPGNVRELKNICSQIAIHSHDRQHAAMPPSVKALLRPAPDAPATPATITDTPEERRLRTHGKTTDDAVLDALQRNQWNVTKSAKELGMSKNALTNRIRKIPGLRLAGDLSLESIRQAMTTEGDDINVLAKHLKVSAHGLRIRMRELGLR